MSRTNRVPSPPLKPREQKRLRRERVQQDRQEPPIPWPEPPTYKPLG